MDDLEENKQNFEYLAVSEIKVDNATQKQSKKEIEIRKLSAAAGGGLVGFAFGGPIGAIIGSVITSMAANFYFENDEEDIKNKEGGL